MLYANYTPEEVEARGEAIYKEQIRDRVEPENKGKFLVVDIETGDYEIDADDLRATMRALAKRPAAILYGLRIGYPTSYRLGGRFRLLEASYELMARDDAREAEALEWIEGALGEITDTA